MKTLQHILLVSALFFFSTAAHSSEPVKGLLQYKSVGNTAIGDSAMLYMASVIIPVQERGIPIQIKAVISEKKEALEKDKKGKGHMERFLFLNRQDGINTDKNFILRGSDLFAEIGIVNPKKEKIALFLVYRKEQRDSSVVRGRDMFVQQRVELTGVTVK